jgi:hypothetical protein
MQQWCEHAAAIAYVTIGGIAGSQQTFLASA